MIRCEFQGRSVALRAWYCSHSCLPIHILRAGAESHSSLRAQATLISMTESTGFKEVQLIFAPSNQSDGVSNPSSTFPLPLPSPSICHCPSRRIVVLVREDKKVPYRSVSAQCWVLSHTLIFDDLFKIYLYCPHSAPSAFLTFSPFLLKSYSSFKASSGASHLLCETLSTVRIQNSHLSSHSSTEMTHL